MINDNGIRMLFERHAKIGINNIFSTYGNVHSVADLRCVIDSSVSHRDCVPVLFKLTETVTEIAK